MKKLEDYGYIQSRPRGEYHANNQQMSKLLHTAVQLGGKGPGSKVLYPILTLYLPFTPHSTHCLV